MYLAVATWAHQDDVHAMTEILEMDGSWSSEELLKLRKGEIDGKSIHRFFKEKGLTPHQVRQLIPSAHIVLYHEQDNDPRLGTLEGWDDVCSQSPPLGNGCLDTLASYLGMPVVVVGTMSKYQQTPILFGQSNPR